MEIVRKYIAFIFNHSKGKNQIGPTKHNRSFSITGDQARLKELKPNEYNCFREAKHSQK